MLPIQLSHLGLGDKTSLVSRFVECFKTMWANNGDLVSRTYTGTGAMEGGARVRCFMTFFKDVFPVCQACELLVSLSIRLYFTICLQIEPDTNLI
jgi:hypothetical protein